MVSFYSFLTKTNFKKEEQHKAFFCLNFPALSTNSSPPRPWAQPDQQQSDGHPGVMAAPTREAESWPSQRLPLVLSHQCWEYYLTGRTTWRQNTASPGKPAAGYHLSAAYCRCHQCRVGWAVCLDISPHSKGIQCSRYNIWKSCPHNLWDSRCVARPNVQTHCKKYYHLYIEEIVTELYLSYGEE